MGRGPIGVAKCNLGFCGQETNWFDKSDIAILVNFQEN